jgi:hypothetical protein
LAFYLTPPLDNVKPRLVEWAKECRLDYLVYKSTACAYVLVLSRSDSNVQIGLARGSRTVAQKLMLSYLPPRIKPGGPFLEKLIKLTNKGQAPVVLWSKGHQYTLPILTQTMSKAGQLTTPLSPLPIAPPAKKRAIHIVRPMVRPTTSSHK